MTNEDVSRRLAAIVSADVVGYSGIIGHDEEDTFAALRRHRFIPSELRTLVLCRAHW
jgi:hypothetical protein